MANEHVNIVTDDGREVPAVAPTVVSASRATDIPAFYADWFFNRLEKGYLAWRNPFNRAVSYVSLRNTRFVVFWSKNPAPLLPRLPLLARRGIGCYVQYTLNDYAGEGLEPGVPPLEQRIKTMEALSRSLGVSGVVWRFDPLVLTDRLGVSELLERVKRVAERVAPYTQKLVFSFADISGYRRVASSLAAHRVAWREWTPDTMRAFARGLASEAASWGLELATCSEKIDLSDLGIARNCCIDQRLIAMRAPGDAVLMRHIGVDVGLVPVSEESFKVAGGLWASPRPASKDKGQRTLCGCMASKDIGAYGTCPHRCLYCYAQGSGETALDAYRRHLENPAAEML